MTREFITASPEETEKLAASLVSDLQGIRVISLEGSLGAGKTVFARGLAKAVGAKKNIQSPTFVVMKVYELPKKKPGRLGDSGVRAEFRRLVHADCYRLSGSKELREIGIDDYLSDPSSLVVIEWGDRVSDLLPPGTLRMRFEFQGETMRRITLLTPEDRALPGARSGT